MLETSARLLRLLSLLQTRRDWPGSELAERLEVSPRTIRRDIDRLRELGYPVHALRGAEGGYRLGVGAKLPPLLLDDEEAVAVAVSLRTSAGSVGGIEETAVRALAKLEMMLPPRLSRQVDALQNAIVQIPSALPTVEPSVLTALAGACRDQERVKFDYRAHDGTSSVRSVDPHKLVCWGRRWYLLAWDRDREDWRTFRVDRISLRSPTGQRSPSRAPPDGDVVAWFSRQMSAMWRYQAKIKLHAPADALGPFGIGNGLLEPLDERTTLLHVGSESLAMLATALGFYGVDFEVLEPPELVEQVALLARRYDRAVTSAGLQNE
jgi:predicted DNA-binding transcriptional regulator YafY